MHDKKRVLAVVGATLALFAVSAPAHAQATRTWVSGVGDDANPCSRTGAMQDICRRDLEDRCGWRNQLH